MTESSRALMDDRGIRTVYLNGFSPGSLADSDIADYFGLLYGGHVRRVWIARKFGAHALVEFDGREFADRTIQQRKHRLRNDGPPLFAWKCSKGVYSKRNKKRKLDDTSIDSEDWDTASTSTSTFTIDSDRGSNGFGHVRDQTSIRELYDSLRITDDELRRREDFRADLERRISDIEVWPRNSRFILIGSTVNGFGWRNSDVDLTFLVDSVSDSSDGDRRMTADEFRRLDPIGRLEIMASTLRDLESDCISDIVQIHGRRCPLIKFKFNDSNGSIHCELSVDNPQAVMNTLWLHRLASEFKFLPVLYTMFRWWIRKWNTAEKSTSRSTALNGFTIALITVAYFQHQGSICKDYNPGEDHKIPISTVPWTDTFNQSQLLDLFRDLIQFISEIRWKQTVFSPALQINDRPIMSALEFITSEYYKDGFRFSHINVQDPYDRSHNTAWNVSEENLKHLTSAVGHWIDHAQRHWNEEAWKVFTWTVDIVDDVDSSTDRPDRPIFVCQPSADNLISLLRHYARQDVGRQWCQLAVKAILEIFNDILKFRTAEEGATSETELRFHCLAWHVTWQMDKRKIVFKKLADDSGIGAKSKFRIEREISELIVSQQGKGKKKRSIEPVGEFTLILRVINERDRQELIGRIAGDKNIGMLKKFMHGLVETIFDDALRRVCSNLDVRENGVI